MNHRPNLLADWTILLVGYDGEVAADGSQAGENLEEGEDSEGLNLFNSHFILTLRAS